MPDCTLLKIKMWCEMNSQKLDIGCLYKDSENAENLHIVVKF